jgi:hypothetical protein
LRERIISRLLHHATHRKSPRGEIGFRFGRLPVLYRFWYILKHELDGRHPE